MWMKVDDGLHAHRKTRAVTKSHATKSRDAAPMGIWVLAGSWSSQNGTDGWVPEDELDRWDDDWRALTDRLVRAGYWWPHQRDGEPGYGFTNWHDYNDPADMASKAGTYGNHVRWHVNEGKVDPECEHCPAEPDRGDIAPDIPPDSGGDRGAIGGYGLPATGGVQKTASSASSQVSRGASGGRFAKRIGCDRSTRTRTRTRPEPDPRHRVGRAAPRRRDTHLRPPRRSHRSQRIRTPHDRQGMA